MSAIAASGLRYQYDGSRGIADASFAADRGEIVCIFGWNGAGKTTLFRVLSTLVPPQAGSLQIGGCDARRDREEARRKMFPVSDGEAHFSHLTGRENAQFFLSLYGVPRPKELDRLADDFDLDLDRPAGEYSLGMQRKLLLAESFAAGRDVLLFDEPTLGLDTGMRPVFFTKAREAAAAGSCIIIGTNRIEDAGCADRILRLDNGTLCPAPSVAALVNGMVQVTATFDDRCITEFIPSADDLPDLVKGMLTLGIPRKIEIGGDPGHDTEYWTAGAEEKLRGAPKFLQDMIRSLVERHARENGYRRITPAVVDEAKRRFEQR